MSDPFGVTYASVYDDLYATKNYVGECDLIEKLFARHVEGRVRRVLDLGCGTGGHSVILAQRGFEVVGIDRSEAMLAEARRKAIECGVSERTVFQRSDIASLLVGAPCDAALLLFAVLGYQQGADALACLRSARAAIRMGGLLVGDLWYGPAVLAQGPSQRWRMIRTGNEQVLRFSSGELDEGKRACAVTMHLWRVSGSRLIAELEDTHVVRYFFQDEIVRLLQDAGFRLLQLGAFPDVDREADETTWNVTYVAKAT